MKVCIVGASGKLGQYMVQHCLDRGYEVVGVCRSKSVDKLDRFKDRITIFPGATNDREVIKMAVAECKGVLTVFVWYCTSSDGLWRARSTFDLLLRMAHKPGW